MTAIETRQVIRARARANDYWTPNEYGRLVAPRKPRTCRQTNAAGRDHTSRNLIAAKTPRKRLKPRPEGRFAKGYKLAWQRKAAARAAMLKAQGIAA